MPSEYFRGLSRQRQQAIGEAAIDVFSRSSFEDAQMEDVAKVLGVTSHELGRSFEDTFDLYHWLILEEVAHVRGEYTTEVVGDPEEVPDLFEHLNGLLLGGLRLVKHRPKLAKISFEMLSSENTSKISETRRVREAIFFKHFRGLLIAAQRRGQLREGLNLDVATSQTMYLLGVYIIDLVAIRLGMDRDDFLKHPEAAKTLTDQDLGRLADHVSDLMRHGFASFEQG